MSAATPVPSTERVHPLEFGVALNPEAARIDELIRLAQLADSRGFELLGLMDHPYMGVALEAWTLLSVLAARTERIKLFPDVANLPLRPPAMLAKAAASLDLISGGRIELGLGAGAAAEVGGGGMGGPHRSPGEAIDALEEAVEVIRHVWAAESTPVTYSGKHYHLDGVVTGPAPAHRIGVWLGAYRPRMLAVTGRIADGWLPSFPYLDPAGLIGLNKHLDEAAVAAGRSPSDVRRLYNIIGAINPRGNALFNEGPAAWTERITELVLAGRVSGVILTPMADHERQIEIFNDEIAPAVRSAVAKESGAR